eukprot:62192-Prymnesium_polylepis.1
MAVASSLKMEMDEGMPVARRFAGATRAAMEALETVGGGVRLFCPASSVARQPDLVASLAGSDGDYPETRRMGHTP